MRRVFAAVIAFIVVGATAPVPVIAQGTPPFPRPPVAAAQGTGTVRGVVVTGDEPQPLGGAMDRLSIWPLVPPTGQFTPFSATTMADGTGRFEFTGVPPGAVSLIAEKVASSMRTPSVALKRAARRMRPAGRRGLLPLRGGGGLPGWLGAGDRGRWRGLAAPPACRPTRSTPNGSTTSP